MSNHAEDGFRGPNSSTSVGVRHRHTLLLVLVCLAAWWLPSGLWDISGADEGRYTQVARELLTRSNWLVLTVRGEPYDQKPPLPFWVWAVMLWLRGGEINEWLLRLPSVVMGIAAVLATHRIAARRWGDRAALLSALCLVATPLFFRQAATVRLDILLSGCTTMAVAIYLARDPSEPMGKRAALAFWFVNVAAFFTKGPPAWLIVFPLVLADCVRLRSWRPWRRTRPLAGWTLLLCLIGLWQWMQARTFGWEFVRGQAATADRLTQGDHGGPFYEYILDIFGGSMAPWSYFAVAGIWAWWKRRREEAGETVTQVVLWLALPLLVFTLAHGKRAQYLCPLVPPVCLLAGWYMDRFLFRLHSRKVTRAVAIVGGALGVALAVAGIVLWHWPWLLWRHGCHVLPLHLALWVVMGVYLLVHFARLLRGDLVGRTLLASLGAAILLGFVMTATINPAIDYSKSSRRVALEAAALLPQGEDTVGVVEDAARTDYHVYGKYETLRLNSSLEREDGKPLAALPTLLFVRMDDLPEDGLENRLATHGYRQVYLESTERKALALYSRATSPATPRERSNLLAFAGDTGTGNKDQADVAAQVEAVERNEPIHSFLLLGDNIYSHEPFPTAIVTDFEKPYASLLARGIRFAAVFGNHDHNYPGHYFGELASRTLGFAGRAYYFRTYADGLATIFFLDSETLWFDSEQVAWLQVQAALCKSPWKIIVIHRPLVASAGAHGADETLRRLLLDNGMPSPGFQVVLAGHNHRYERRHLVDGVLHLTLGNGAKLSKAKLGPDPGLATGFNDRCAFGLMEITTDTLQFRVIDQHGRLSDRFDLRRGQSLEVVEQPH